MIFTRVAELLAYLISLLASTYIAYVLWWGWTAESTTVAMNSSDALWEGFGVLIIGIALGVLSDISRNIAFRPLASSKAKSND